MQTTTQRQLGPQDNKSNCLAVREKQVTDRLNKVNTELGLLESSVEEMAKRLEPIRFQTAQSSTNDEKSPPKELMAHLALQIDGHVDRLLKLRGNIDYIISTLEI